MSTSGLVVLPDGVARAAVSVVLVGFPVEVRTRGSTVIFRGSWNTKLPNFTIQRPSERERKNENFL